jgi:hypothetical protein
MSAPLEHELIKLTPDERSAFLADYGLETRARERFIAACYRMLD